jgi:transcriptional regulator with XRE-family HTH domain
MPKEGKTSALWTRFSEGVLDLPERKSMVQDDISTEIGVEQTSVSAYKTGARVPSLDVALKLAQYAGLCVQYLLRGDGPRRPWWDMDSQFQKLIECWEYLDDAGREKLVQRAEELRTLQDKHRRPRWQPPAPDKPPRRPQH